MLQIRIATTADTAAIAALHTQSWRIAYKGILSDHYLQNELDQDRLADWQTRFSDPAPNQYVIVAEDEQAGLMGFACAYGKFDPEVGTLIENLHAHPAHKKTGVGKLMLADIARWSLRHFPGDLMHLWVLTENAAAIGFYRHMGARQDMQAIWDAPGGTQVPELRFTWFQPERLI